MIETQLNRVKIEQHNTGWVIIIKEKNWIKTIEYHTPCYIKYLNRLILLEKDFIIDSKNPLHKYTGETMKALLPSLLENGEMVPK